MPILTKIGIGTGILLFVSGQICLVRASLLHLEMVDRVNELLPAEKQFEILGWYLSKYQKARQEYKRFYPDGRLLVRIRNWTIAGFSLFLTAVALFLLITR